MTLPHDCGHRCCTQRDNENHRHEVSAPGCMACVAVAMPGPPIKGFMHLPMPTPDEIDPPMLRDLADRLDDTPAGGTQSVMMGEASNTLRAAADRLERDPRGGRAVGPWRHGHQLGPGVTP